MKKMLTILLCTFLFLVNLTPLYAKEDTLAKDNKYRVVNVAKDGTMEIIKTSDDYAQAKVSHTLLRNKYNNLGITYGDSFMTIEQGVVEFKTKADCTLNVTYTNAANGKEGYTNGCYGIDAAFLEFNPANQQVKFLLSGVSAWIDGEDVTIYPREQVPTLTSFSVVEGALYHNLKSNIASESYANSLLLSKAPAYLKEKTTYYSYDSHYFYEDFGAMIEDYRDGNREHAINVKEPYYNYYQYSSHRTTSAYTASDIQTYFKDTLAINQTLTDFYDKDNYIHDILTQSLLLQGVDAFLQYQNQFGVNALMMLSLAMNESALGRSGLAFSRNNVFGHAAYDSDVEKNASRYASVAGSIYSHALHYISNSYANPTQFQFKGSFFGNKAGGMNVQYASDPYWGEKAAQYYYEMDKAMGGKDENQYALGISTGEEVSVYKTATDKKDAIFKVDKGIEYAFVLVEKVVNDDGTWYRIQSDPALDSNKAIRKDGLYSFSDSYGYIRASDVGHILNSDKIQTKDYVGITFDANGGTFYPEDKQVVLQVESGVLPSITSPTKQDALFQQWDKKIEPATSEVTYKAQYQDVASLQLTQSPQTQYNLNDMLSVKDGRIEVSFVEGGTKEVALTTDMVSGYDAKKEGKQTLQITYAGKKIAYEVNVSKSMQTEIDALKAMGDGIIRTYNGKTDLTKEALAEISRFKEDVDALNENPFTRDQIRALDSIFQNNLSPAYSVSIKDKHYDLQVSGAMLAIHGTESFLNKIMPKTIVFSLKRGASKASTSLGEKIATANHMQLRDSFTLSGKDDVSGLKLEKEMLFSIKKPSDANTTDVFRVYYVDGEDVYQLPTTQSATRIQFMSKELGNYVLVSQSSSTTTTDVDPMEVNKKATNGPNYITRYILVPSGIVIMAGIGFCAFVIYRRKKMSLVKKTKRNRCDT